MNPNEASKINLAAIRKVDSSISSIVDSANQVALYKYVFANSKWEKTDIEGTLFVYTRSGKPQHSFMVMNRLSTVNLIEPVTEKLEFQNQTPFLLYRNGKDEIYGIWFYEEKYCVKIFKLLSSLLQLVPPKSDKSSSIRQRSYSESNRKLQKQEKAQLDIISLLTRAQDEYDKKSAAKESSSKSAQRTTNGDIVKPTPVRINGETITTSNSTPLTLGMLFAQAGGIEKRPDEDPKDFNTRVRSFTANGVNNLSNNTGMNTETILQNLLSNSAHTLHHIDRNKAPDNSSEKESKTVPEVRPLSANGPVLTAESLEKDLKEKLNILPKTSSDLNDCEPFKMLTEPAKSQPIDIPILTPAMLNSLMPSSVPSGVVGSFAEKSEKIPENVSPSFLTESRSYSPNQLLSPMDFTIPCRKKNLQPTHLSSSYSPEPLSSVKNGFKNGNEDLLHPQAFINGPVLSRSLSLNKPSSVTPLNKDQFKEALIYMLQSDENFVIQLHECYLKSLKSQLNLMNSS